MNRLLPGSNHNEAPLRIGLIGCGAVVELLHLPALLRRPDLRVTAAIDRSMDRARLIAESFPGATAFTSYAEAVSAMDAAIVALPNRFHAEAGCDLLRKGIHVLMEKPLAVTTAECERLQAAAMQGNAVLAAAMVRRFPESTRFVSRFLQSGMLGRIERVEMQMGGVFNWPVASDALFRADLSGGGVLIDAGVHGLDLLIHWLGDVEQVNYFDDSLTGVESECRLELVLRSGTRCVLEFSRIRNLSGACHIHGTNGSLRVGSGFDPELQLRIQNSESTLSGRIAGDQPPAVRTLEDAFDAQLEDFVDAITKQRPPLAPASEARKAIAVIETCYRNRQPIALPWLPKNGAVPETLKQARESLRGKQVLVIGGTGFIGGRLVESLVLDCGARVRVLVRDFMRASRLAALGVEMMAGDLTTPEDVNKAAEGCEVVFHSAYGNRGDANAQRLATVAGTQHTLQAAKLAGADRLVYLSTLDVYGAPRDINLSEETPRRSAGDIYSATKLDAENLCLQYARQGLPVAVLQPTVVYGPFGPIWTAGILASIGAGRLALVDGGEGYCNAVYVDDLIQAMLLSATGPRATGEMFLISGESHCRWRDYFGAYADMLGCRLPEITAGQALSIFQQRRQQGRLLAKTKALFRENAAVRSSLLGTPEATWLAATAKRLFPRDTWKSLKTAALPPSQPDPAEKLEGMSQDQINYYTAKLVVSIGKAKSRLDYRPAFSLERGMAQTRQWARWANII